MERTEHFCSSCQLDTPYPTCPGCGNQLVAPVVPRQTAAAKRQACAVEETANGWSVCSPSGSTYDVTSKTCLDDGGSMYFKRRCSCPARGDCVHLAAVLDWQMSEAADAGDYDGMDVLERVE